MTVTTAEHCRSCDAPIIWARSVASGKNIPLNADQVEPGTAGSMLLVHGRAYSMKRRAEALADWHRVLGDTRTSDLPHHFAHFVTCPNAAQHRASRRSR